MWNKTLLAAAVASFALPASAQDAAPPASAAHTDAPSEADNGDGGVLDSVTVIGHRRNAGFKAANQVSGKLPMTLRETPQSVSVLTRDSLDVRQVFSLQQAFELSAGVTQYSGTGPFAGQPSFGFNQTTIRGIAIDDQYDFRDDGFVSGSFFSVPDLAIYQRVEVVKGPNSTLYGRGSVGGLINRIRKKPLGEKRTQIEVSAGSFETWRTDFDTTGPMTESGAVRGRLTAVYEDSGSFVRGVETQRTVLAPSVEADLTPSTRLLVQALHQSEDIIPNTGIALRQDGQNFKAPNISRRQYMGVPTRDPYAWTIESLSAQLEQGLGDRWLATLRLSASKTDTPIRTDAYIYGFTEGDDPSTTDVTERRGDTSVLGNDFAIDRDIFSTELQLNGAFELAGREAKVGLGADFNENQYSRRGMYTDSVMANIYDADFTLPDPTLKPGFQTTSTPRSTGFYAQTQLPLNDRLKVLLGARYDSVKLDSVPYHALNDATPAAQTETIDDLTARLGVTFDVNPRVSVYALWAQSFTPELSATDINGELLAPETGEIFELGTKTEWFDGRLGISAAVYQVDRDDIAIGAETAPGEPRSRCPAACSDQKDSRSK